ncbi:MAG: GC-type dockerin domain-anchored protein [Planctomycetota bacterium]
MPTAQGEVAEARLTVINGRTFELTDASQFETTARLVRPGEAGQGFGEGWVFRSEVIVKAEDERAVLEAMGRFAIAHAGGAQVDFVRTLSEKHGYFLLSRPSVGDAVELANWLNQSELVERAMLDHVPGRYGASLPVAAAPRVRDDLVTGANGAGVAALPAASRGDIRNVTPTDPLIVNDDFWHINNTTNPGADHRIDEVHALGINGAGVTIGLVGDRAFSLRRNFDPFHPDLTPNARLDLGQEIDPFFPASVSMTMAAGLIGSAANTIGGAGVAFQSELVPLRNGSITEEFDALRFNSEIIDVRLYSDYVFAIQSETIDSGGFLFAAGSNFAASSNTGANRFFDDLPLVAIQEATDDGNIFVTEVGDDSLFPGFGAYFGAAHAIRRTDEDDSEAVTEELGTFDGMAFTPGAPHVSMGGWTEYDGIANSRNVLAIGAVGEDGLRAPYSRMGPSVLAVAYSVGGDATTFDPTLAPFPPRVPIPPYDGELIFLGGVTPPFGTLDGVANRQIASADISGQFNGVDLGIDPGDFATGFGGTTSAAAVATGIVALMKQANPGLSLRDIKAIIQQTSIPSEFDPTLTYWFNAGLPAVASTWQINAAFNIHSDAYGFGIIDAKAAVDLAQNWAGLPEQELFETGVIPVDIEIPEAEFVNIAENVDQLVPGDEADFQFCVRPNVVIEEIELEMNIEGIGRGELLIWLRSPFNTVSVMAIPRYDFNDFQAFSDGTTEFAYFNYVFHTYKHWGERSGGRWEINVQDFGVPDVPESSSVDDGGYLTILGTAGSRSATWGTHAFEEEVIPLRPLAFDQKTWQDFNMRIYGYVDGTPPFEGCPVGAQNCPGDLNSDFVVDVSDLLIFLEQFENGSLLADITGDGRLTIDDIFSFLFLWQPGFCNVGGGGIGNRPLPSDSPNPAIGPGVVNEG